jgi:hypothetical protein
VRLTFAIFLALLLSGSAYGQTGNDPEHVIRQVIDSGFLDGHDRKVLGRLGDAGAVLVTKILAGREPTPGAIGGALLIIVESFADPSFVESAPDREPRTALLVLRYLDLSTNDLELKNHIVDTRKYIQDRYAASLQATKP